MARIDDLSGEFGSTSRARALLQVEDLSGLAPAEDGDDEVEIASARFIVLYDPAGQEAWHGTMRCVGYLSAATDEQMVDDTMFSEVAWSWLTDALTESGAVHHAVGGTVTRTASTRFVDI